MDKFVSVMQYSVLLVQATERKFNYLFIFFVFIK